MHSSTFQRSFSPLPAFHSSRPCRCRFFLNMLGSATCCHLHTRNLSVTVPYNSTRAGSATTVEILDRRQRPRPSRTSVDIAKGRPLAANHLPESHSSLKTSSGSVPLPLRVQRRQTPRHRGHRVRLAGAPPARSSRARPDPVPRGQPGRHPSHRLRCQQQRQYRDRNPSR